jgi:hypothetical protein
LNRTEKATLITTDIIFFLLALAAAWLGKLPDIPGLWFPILLGLAAFRGGRAIAHNLIFSWLRDLFGVVEVEDSSGAGKSNVATGRGVRRILGELVCCPVCSGTWVAITLLLLYSLEAKVGAALIYALAAAGLGELFEWLSEMMFWKGRSAREDSGTQWMYKNKPEILHGLDDRASGEPPRSSTD